ncbi:MAG: hypothetical protein Q9M40_07810 [Sulfurimonas sp.]|nr:hypothetical protein [Sulfurimonas sp.]
MQIGIATGLDGSANFYLFKINDLKKHIIAKCPNFKIIDKSKTKDDAKREQQPLNQILYGPPGTGKTYNTLNKAIEIIENRVVDETEDRAQLKVSFDEYRKSGQIEFITFHQSYGYEEFVEGIKATTVNEQISYDVVDGVFKKLAEKAEKTTETVKKR